MNNETLVAQLIRERALKSQYLVEAFLSVDRGDFVPDQYRAEAYRDEALPLLNKSTISQPRTVAFMLELLQPQPNQKVLDVGAGSGWTTALLAECVGEGGHVIGLEYDLDVLRLGQDNLKRYNYPQAEMLPSQAGLGLPQEAPFDRILVSAAAGTFPEELADQLIEGGIMVIPINHSLFKAEKFLGGDIELTEFPGFSFVPLI